MGYMDIISTKWNKNQLTGEEGAAVELHKLEWLKRYRKQILIKFDWEWYFLNNSEYHGGFGRELNYLANRAFDELLDAEIQRRRGEEAHEYEKS